MTNKMTNKMTNEKINESLDAMLIDQKAKKFLNHMVRSYFPLSNVGKVFDKPSGDFKCALTRIPLVSIMEVMEIIKTDEYKAEFLKSIKVIVDGETEINPTISNFLGGKILGFTGKDTTTFLSFEAYKIFYSWVMNKSLIGDKHIQWLLNKIKHEDFLTREKSYIEKQAKAEERKTASFKLGDTNSVLANLKAKMEAEGI